MNLDNNEIFGDIDTSGMLSSSQSDGLGALVGLNTTDFFQTDGMPTDDDNTLKWEPNSHAFLPNMYPEDANCFDTKPSTNFPANIYFGDHVTKAPSLDELNNERYNLNVSMLGSGSGSNSGPNYYYSTELQKLFVKKKHSFTVDVSYSNVLNEPLFLRVMLLCSAPHEKHRTISRCPHDMSTDTRDTASVSQSVHEHVVRCLDPSPLYVGKTGGSAFQDRLAVIISLSGTGHGLNVPVSLEFRCQNSCPTIERRPTALVFTLENERCDIYGRKLMNVKVCSCPKRDKAKEEKNRTGTKRKVATESVVDEQPPRKLTRQSSVSSSRDNHTVTSQCNSPMPTSTAAITRIKKENEGSLSRSSSNLSTSSSFLENDAAGFTLKIRLPNIAMAVDVAEYAFMKAAAYLIRCKNDIDDYTRYSNYLSHYRRVKKRLEMNQKKPDSDHPHEAD